MSFEEGLGRAIRVLRTGQDKSRRDLADAAGVSYSYLSEIEQGAKSPSPRTLAAIAGALGLEVHELMEAAADWREPTGRVEVPRSSPGVEFLAEQGEPAAASYAMFDSPDDFKGPIRSRRARGMPAPEAEEQEPGFLSRLGRRRSARKSFRHRASAHGAEDPTDLPASLVEDIGAGRCVAFIGAGFSRAAALPGWQAALQQVSERAGVPNEVAELVSERVEANSAYALYEAAQVLEDQVGRERFLELLAKVLRVGKLPPAMRERLELLRGIPFRTILTTNFDALLPGEPPSHQAYREALRPARHRWWNENYWNQQGAFTLKLHGDLAGTRAGEDSVVLTRRDYRRRLYEDRAYETFLRAVMATTTVLYMGFSFEDAYLNELRSEILALLGQRTESHPVAYAIVNDVPEGTQDHFRRHEGIHILSYDSDHGRDFAGFDRYLRAIYDATSPVVRFARYLEHKRILWVDAHPDNNAPVRAHLLEAARRARRDQSAVRQVLSADEGIRALQTAAREQPFELVITHWGEGDARDDSGQPTSAAERLLTRMRALDLRCPVVVFAAPTDIERRRRIVLGLGAQAYCFGFEQLYQAIERVLAPAEEAV